MVNMQCRQGLWNNEGTLAKQESGDEHRGNVKMKNENKPNLYRCPISNFISFPVFFPVSLFL